MKLVYLRNKAVGAGCTAPGRGKGGKGTGFTAICSRFGSRRFDVRSLVLLFSLALFSCSSKTGTEQVVTVTIEPLRYFAEAIGGDKYTVKSMVGAGMNPENYDPTPRQMVDLGKSRAYFEVGSLGFEQAWMDRIRENNPQLQVFTMSDGFDLLEEPDGATHADEGDETGEHNGEAADAPVHHHTHGGTDPHIWSSFSGARQIARNTLQAFITLDPENEAYYRSNYRTLLDEIGRTEQEVRRDLDSLQARTFIIYHPALTYLAREFDLTQLSIEFDGKEPTPAQLKELIETARRNGVKVVFVQMEFDRKNAELIAGETGCELVSINPLSYDWNGEMLRIARALAYGKVD